MDACAACRASVLSWALAGRNGPGYKVSTGLGLKHLTLRLPALLRCIDPLEPIVIVDVGAGIHNIGGNVALSATRLHADDSDALWLLAGFGERADVHGIEPNPRVARQLRQAAGTRRATRNFTAHFHVHQLAMGDTERLTKLNMCGVASTFALADLTSNRRGCGAVVPVNETTLDAFAPRVGAARGGLLYVKADIEGGEFALIRGMRGLLAAQKVQMLSFEYSSSWGAFHASRSRENPRKTGETLAALQRMLDGWGYDTYIIHAVKPNPQKLAKRRNIFSAQEVQAHVDAKKAREIVLTLVRASGSFWSEHLEICANTSRFYKGGHCWTDMIAVRRSNACAKRTLLHKATRTAQLFPLCDANGCL